MAQMRESSSGRPRESSVALRGPIIDVAYAGDEQTLELPNGHSVTAQVHRGKVTVRLKHSDGKTRSA